MFFSVISTKTASTTKKHLVCKQNNSTLERTNHSQQRVRYMPDPSGFPIEVTDVTPASSPNVWLAQALLPNKDAPSKVMIFVRDEKYTLVAALCPHLHYDLSEVNLNEAGELICPLHNMVINLYAEGIDQRTGRKANKRGYEVTRQGDKFLIIGPNT